jgi:hypothetical protein
MYIQIYDNLICNNPGIGVSIYGGMYNRIWNNTFIGNNGSGIQAYDIGANNWNTSGSPHGYGNYWDDWTTPDANSDGIVDNPYSIMGSAGAEDYYPLVSPCRDNPITTASLSGTEGTNDWFISDVSVSLSATDACSGVASTFYRIGTSGGWSTYSSSFDISSEGVSTVQFYSVDNAGNTESVKSATVKIDKADPTTSYSLSGTIGTNGWYVSPVTLILTPSDAVSGIDYTEYSTDGGMSWSDYTAPLVISSDGAHTVSYRSVDMAINTETMQSVSFKIDKTKPVSSFIISNTFNENGWFNTSIVFTSSSKDAMSGIKWTKYSIDGGGWFNYTAPFGIVSDGIHDLSCFSCDLAGNEEQEYTTVIMIDQTPPMLTFNQSGNLTIDKNYTVISWNGTDKTSGIDRFEVKIDGGSFVSIGEAMLKNFSALKEGTHNVTVKAIDKAGNWVAETLMFTVNTSASGGNNTGGSGAGTLSDPVVLAVIGVAGVGAAAAAAVVIRNRKKP